MKFAIKLAAPQDEHFLWHMVYEAARMSEAGEPVEAAQHNPALAPYVAHWGQAHDVGYIASNPDTGQRVAAAWFRLLQVMVAFSLGPGLHYDSCAPEVPGEARGVLPVQKCCPPSTRGLIKAWVGVSRFFLLQVLVS